MRICRVLVYEHFRAIIQGAEHPSLYVEKAIICLLLLCVKLLAKNEIRARILRALGVFVHLKPAVADAMSETVAVGVANMVKSHAQAISYGEHRFTTRPFTAPLVSQYILSQ